MPKKKFNISNQSAMKGKILEMVVAGLHEAQNVKVQKNVRLPTLRNPQRKREIDVLLSGFFAGYPIRIAIECKNRTSSLDIPYIDAFIGKLDDIGIPVQHGILISPVGFTSGAIERAKEVGIRTLIFSGLTSDLLSEEIIKAIQSITYLLLSITSLTIESNVLETENSFQFWFLYNKERSIQTSIPELIWDLWSNGKIPPVIGESEIKLTIPNEFYNDIDGRLEPVLSVGAKLKIIGFHVLIDGKATRHALINPVEQTMNKFKAKVSFDIPREPLLVSAFYEEDELQSFLKQKHDKIRFSVINRVTLPRIKFHHLYWPLSSKAINQLRILYLQCNSEGRKPTESELALVEGNDLKAVWDSI